MAEKALQAGPTAKYPRATRSAGPLSVGGGLSVGVRILALGAWGDELVARHSPEWLLSFGVEVHHLVAGDAVADIERVIEQALLGIHVLLLVARMCDERDLALWRRATGAIAGGDACTGAIVELPVCGAASPGREDLARGIAAAARQLDIFMVISVEPPSSRPKPAGPGGSTQSIFRQAIPAMASLLLALWSTREEAANRLAAREVGLLDDVRRRTRELVALLGSLADGIARMKAVAARVGGADAAHHDASVALHEAMAKLYQATSGVAAVMYPPEAIDAIRDHMRACREQLEETLRALKDAQALRSRTIDDLRDLGTLVARETRAFAELDDYSHSPDAQAGAPPEWPYVRAAARAAADAARKLLEELPAECLP